MTYPEQVKSRLWSDIRIMSEQAEQFVKKPGVDFSRTRKLGFGELMHFLISMQSGTTGHELLKYFDYSADAITASGFLQQRNKLLPDAMRHLLLQFNSHFPFEVYNGIYRLLAVDGAEFNIFRNPDDPGTYHPPTGRSKKGFNALHTVSLYDLINKRYLDCMIQPGKMKNEFRAICDLADRYQHGGVPVFIGDRGFSCYNFFAHAIEKGIFFLIRAKDVNAKRLLGLKELPECIDADVEIILTRTQSKKKWMRPDLAAQYRFICSEVTFDFIEHGSDDEYHLPLRVVRVPVADGVYENLITNLPAGEVSADELKHWYNLRWGIETSFRDLKHTIGTVNFHSKKVDFIVQELWARLILFNFCTIIALHVVIKKKGAKYVYQVNYAMAIKVCHHFIRLRGREPPPDVVGLIGKYALPIRPLRRYARQHRFQFPTGFCYRFS